MPELIFVNEDTLDDLSIKKRSSERAVQLLDEWVMEPMTIAGRKIALMVHTRTLLTLLFPFTDLNKIDELSKAFYYTLEYFLCKNGFSAHAQNLETVIIQTTLFHQLNNPDLFDYIMDIKNDIQSQGSHLFPYRSTVEDFIYEFNTFLNYREMLEGIVPVKLITELLEQGRIH